MKHSILLLLTSLAAIPSFAQNNAIFNGGDADGINSAAFAQSSNNIFAGGAGDGTNTLAFSQAFTNIFNGGLGDGFNNSNFAQATVNIFNGGLADGWSSANFAQPLNNIFNGGNGDGWNSIGFAQAGNDIFNGGIGDGWASTYRPLGPLPVTLLSFAAEKINTSSLLQWQVTDYTTVTVYEVERSNNALQFVKIGAVANANRANYQFTDAFPMQGNNYYRLKLIEADGSFKYTPVRVVYFGNEKQSLQVFPNPVNSYASVLLTAEMMQEDLILNVVNTAGQVVIHQKLPKGTNAVFKLNMLNLPGGTYIIHVRGKSTNNTASVIKQ